MSGMDEAGESFLARWSRLKARGIDAGTTAIEPKKPAEPAQTGTALAADDATSLVDLTKLPRLEDLTANSDFAAFLQKGVPEALQRMALRKAWSSDPAIRDFVEVAENQYDWNAVGGVPGFGPLPAGTDLQALLAQAIGEKVKAEPESEQGPAPAPDVDAAQPSAVAAVAGRGAEHDKTSAENGVATASAGAAPAAATTVARPALVAEDRAIQIDGKPGRARHGGALPRLPDSTA